MATAQNISSQTDQQTKSRIKPPRVITLFILLIIIISACILYFLYVAKGNKLETENQRSVAPSIPSNTTTARFFIPTTVPSAAPLLGPGPYACDPQGICNHYADAIGVGCPKTYADPYCLGECSDEKVQCPK